MRHVVIGGGIAGISVVEQLLRELGSAATRDAESEVILISASSVLKGITNVVRITDSLEGFEVVERPLRELQDEHPCLRVIHGVVSSIDHVRSTVHTADEVVAFDRLCICTGGRPDMVLHHPLAYGIRDTESVSAIRERFASARRVLVVGNGGIALEAVYELDMCDVVWAIRHEYIGNTFFDASASRFFLADRIFDAASGGVEEPEEPIGADGVGSDFDRRGTAGTDSSPGATPLGHALGPCWVQEVRSAAPQGQRRRRVRGRKEGHAPPAAATAAAAKGRKRPRRNFPVRMELGCTVEWLQSPGGRRCCARSVGRSEARAESKSKTGNGEGDDAKLGHQWPVYARLSNGRLYGCDFVICATGVVPAVDFVGKEFERGPDGGLVVNEQMVTTDACHMEWPESNEWFQMRLWTQARTMGLYTGMSMAGTLDELSGGMSFELFAHATSLMGYKVVLLGLYNGQGLGEAYRHAIQSVLASDEGLLRGSTGKPVPETGAAEPGGPAVPLEAASGAGAGVGAGSAAGPAPAPAAAPATSTPEVEVHIRVTPGVEYIKVVLHHGIVRGAMLVGDTDLEETMENLILNKLNVGAMGLNLLDPDVDLEDYFD